VFWVALGAVAAIAIGAIVFTVVGGDDDSSSGGSGSGSTSREFGTVEVTGTPLPSLPSGGDDPAVGETIPTVAGENFREQPVTIAPSGKAQMIVFLAHWCPHCNAEAPRLAAYLAANGGAPPADVDLTIVPTGSNESADNWPPSEWLESMDLADVTTLVDDPEQQAAQAFGLTGYPFIVMVDREGRVVQRRSAEQGDGFFQAAFDALATGQPIPR
jgi:thiol-disulfide isomerase/thioredoxin